MDALPTSPAMAPEVGTIDQRRLDHLHRVGYLLDNSIGIPGTRFRLGLESLIGLVPGIGDAVAGLLSLYIIVEAHRLGVPRALLARMGWNVAIDTLVGEVPILGDLFDIGFKANLRNLALLDGFAQRPVAVRRSSRLLLALIILGVVLVTAGAIALAVLLVQLMSAQLRSGLFQ
ncbi:MAG TPA: DUF4112 domain-containing protein [Gemmatimonadales bacterium]|nr:DUF4112 domain-containing protein [Gemmatimonadales bacterium]